MDCDSMIQVFIKNSGLEIIDIIITTDVRVGRENEKWLNVIMK